MIASLRGQVQTLRDGALVVDVAGVGYLVHVTDSLLDSMHVGQGLELWTYTHVRENDLSLYGFVSAEEHDLFVLMLGVSGIGPRTAMSVIATLAPESLRTAIAEGDVVALSRIPGIGRKTAQRVLLDLTDKIGDAIGGAAPSLIDSADADVINALTALGYSVIEAQAALRSVPDDVDELDGKILAALRSLGGT